MGKNSKNNGAYLGDLPSNYLLNVERVMAENRINSSDIKEDKHGNCTLNGHRIEANACSMIKEDYEIK